MGPSSDTVTALPKGTVNTRISATGTAQGSASRFVGWAVACLPGVFLLALGACGGGQSAVATKSTTGPMVAKKPVGSGARRRPKLQPKSSPKGILRRDLDRLLDAGPGALLQRVPLAPVFGANRKFVGFQIVSVFENNPQALRYGVLPGDFVSRINGHRILTPAHLLQVFETLRNATHLEIAVIRQRQPHKVRVPIVDVPQAQ